MPPFIGKRQTLAVLGLIVAKNVDQSVDRPLSDRLREELFRTDRFIVVDRKNMEKILREQDFQYSGRCDTTECIIEVGKVLGVGKMVAGSLGRLGETYLIGLEMIDVETAEINSIATEKCRCEIDRLADSVCVAARGLVRSYEESR